MAPDLARQSRPCYFVYFSDQNGLIYTGLPIQ